MKRLPIIITLLILTLLFSSQCYAFWIWTPETNKWVNPKYAVKDTPQEQLEFANQYLKSKQYKEAIREYEKLIKYYPKAIEAPEAQFFIAKANQEQGKLYAAFKQYQEVIDKYPFSERSAEIVKIQYNIGLDLLEGAKDKGVLAETFSGTDYNPIDVFRQVIKNDPYGQYASSAQYKIGLYLMEKKMYQEARDEFEKVINDYPDSKWAQAAQYQIAIADATRSSEAQYDQNITQSAVQELKEFATTYPDADFSDTAKKRILELRDKEAKNDFLVAQFYEKQKKYTSAKIYYQIILNEYQDTKWAIKSLNRIRDLAGKENEK